jgi:hypothetical protein
VSLINKLRVQGVVDELQMFKTHLIDPSLSKFVGISGDRAVRNVLTALSLVAAWATFTHTHCVHPNIHVGCRSHKTVQRVSMVVKIKDSSGLTAPA